LRQDFNIAARDTDLRRRKEIGDDELRMSTDWLCVPKT
jgi:hypothetical protein